MNPKTPKFNQALQAYYDNLKLDDKGGQERTCRISGEKFYISVEDIAFYKKMGVPLPTLSPHERTRRKLAFFNDYNLFFNKSAATSKKIISIYSPETPLKIIEHQIWNSDEFKPSDYTVDYNKNKGFFEQYKDFQLKVPRQNLIVRNCVNSDFNNDIQNCKNCYLTFDNRDSENCAYSIYLEKAKEIFHAFGQVNSEIGYDNNLVNNSYRVFFSEYSDNCLDSAFLFDCKNCQNCFMSTNLRHKKYVFYNQQLSREEYEKKMNEINLGSRKEIEKLKKDFQEIKKTAVHRANHNEKNINTTGDYNIANRDCQSCFFTLQCENMKYYIGGGMCKDNHDGIGGQNISQSYESINWSGNDSSQVKFCALTNYLQNCEYCDSCKNCSNCFACIGLKNKQFCIFNKQYTEEKYWKKLDEIKTKMLADGEYGEFFPPELALVPYNISVATSYGGYDDVELAKKYGYKVEEVEEPQADIKLEEITVEQVPDDIKETSDDILNKVIIDKNGKKFRYTKEELAFHRKYNLALPTKHYSTNLARKRIALGPIDFNPKYRNCTKCGKKTQVTFPENHPDAPEKVWCERCYNKSIV